MNDLFLGVLLGAALLGVVGLYFGVLKLIRVLAEHSVFWTIVEEGTAKAIMKYGKFHHIAMVYEGYELDTGWDIEKTKGEEEKRKHPGLVWIGVPFIYSVYKYSFRWTSFEQGEEGGQLAQKTIVHSEVLDYIMVKDDVYYTFIRSAETQDKIPVDVDLLLTIRIVNPYKSLFRVQNWLEATQNQFMPVLRSYIANKPFEELLKRDEGVERDFEALINTLVKPEDEDSRKFKDYLEWHYGVRIKKVGMVRIDPAGERGKVYQEAASKLWEAQKEGERITTLAQAEKKRVETVYETVKNFGDAGLFIKAMETAKAAGEGPSNTIIFPFGSAKDLLRGWIGGKEEKS